MNAKILEINDVTVSFDGFKALNHLTFSMDVGELRVIIGRMERVKLLFWM